ncbi:hypothetical protein E3T29_03160 [Cryobacterium sp. TMT1-66-1]|nr:hypothetical protein E3T29_03160 [Cryobacterium sp. TMT1-66-1]
MAARPPHFDCARQARKARRTTQPDNTSHPHPRTSASQRSARTTPRRRRLDQFPHRIYPHLASADGLRFVVPVRTLNAGSNRRYFGTGRGITSSTSSPTNLPAFTPSSSPARSATVSTSSTVSSSSKQRSNPPS